MEKSNTKDKQIKADLLLLIVVAIWGSTFPVMKIVLVEVDSFYFIALRFSLAFITLSFIYRKYFSRLKKVSFYRGAYLGLWLFAGYATQVIGLKYTTASRSGFITGLAVVMVPIFSVFILKKIPALMNYLGAIIALIGLLFMTGIGSSQIYPGDYLSFFAAISFAMQIVLLSKYLSQGEDPVLLTLVQMGFVAGGAILITLFTDHSYELNLPTIWVIIYTGLLATAFAYLVQGYAQSYTSATHAALIFTMEPVFGAVLSYFFLGEKMTVFSIIGGILIFSGMLVSEIAPPVKRKKLINGS